MNFAIPPKTLEYADLLPPFILLYRDTHNLDITNEKTEVLKTRIKDCACSSFNTYNENGAPLIPKEFAALNHFQKIRTQLSKNRIKVTLLPLLTKVIISKKCEISYLINN